MPGRWETTSYLRDRFDTGGGDGPTPTPLAFLTEYCVFHSYFWAIKSNYEATGNVFDLFKYSFIISNRNNL